MIFTDNMAVFKV